MGELSITSWFIINLLINLFFFVIEVRLVISRRPSVIRIIHSVIWLPVSCKMRRQCAIITSLLTGNDLFTILRFSQGFSRNFVHKGIDVYF
jgi:hypothetical protein